MLCSPGCRLLIIDDEEHITEAVNDYFTILGYLVDCAQDEKTAIDLLNLFEYAAVITDLRLSGCNRIEGLDLIERARAKHPLAACIVLTAYGDAENENEARRRGADLLLQKPAPLGVLAERLAEILGGARVRSHPDDFP